MRLIGAVLLCCVLTRLACGGESAERIADFDIAAQPLSGALLQFSAQSGIQVLLANERVADRAAPSVRGRMASDTALRRLLAGTGLTFNRVDAGTIVLRRAGVSRQPDQPEATTDSSTLDQMPTGALPEEAPLMEIPEIVVTGTRIQVPGNYTAPNPVLTITGE